MACLYITLALHLLLSSSFCVHAAVSSNIGTDLSALLSFKTQIIGDPTGVLNSWNKSLHYCQWQGILCGRRHPDRVNSLLLDSKQLSGQLSPSLANLTFLQEINLSNNHLTGSIPVELGRLRRLFSVNLSTNHLDGIIPSSLGNCSNLEVIDLSQNTLHGTIPSDLAQCKNLRKINLGQNFLHGNIPSEFGVFSQLSMLGVYVNNLTGEIPSTLGNISSLMYLYLDQNSFSGNIPTSLGKLTNLSDLRIFQHNLGGPIPDSFGNLTNILGIHLFLNNLSGPIPPVLGNLTGLIDLSLYENSFSGSIPHTFGNLNYLLYLDISGNRLNGSIPPEIGKLKFLQFLDIGVNDISGKVPDSLYNISAMITLQLSPNLLEGTLPFHICDTLPNLEQLLLAESYFKGQIPPSISNCSSLTLIQLNDNNFSGTIPSTIGKLQNLEVLLLDRNQLAAQTQADWGFIESLTNCSFLQWLILGDNQLQGDIPGSIANLSTRLLYLEFSDNQISGNIPVEIGKLTNLISLQLGNLLLQGTIPKEIGNLWNLQELDLYKNMISGQIPSTLKNFTRMNKLYLYNNALEGSIPPELGQMQALELLDVSNNKLTSKIPKEIMALSSLSIRLNMSHNYLSGILPPEIGKLSNLQSIDLSNNRLSGELPSTIAGCQVVEAIYLNSNQLQGTIPSSLNDLKGLQQLDISNNLFSGQIPGFMGEMNLRYLNISFNNFYGELPKEGIFKNITGLDVRGNPKLCGGIREMHLPRCIPSYPKDKHHSRGNIALICSIVSAFVILSIVIWLLVVRYYKRRSQKDSQTDTTLTLEFKSVSYHNLLRATESFSSNNLIGRGTFGTVYKAIMPMESVIVVAVKVINLEQHGATRSFFSECETLRHVRHRNLIKVLSVCSSVDHQGNEFKAVIFEYMPNGSLEAWLHRNTCTNQPFGSLNLIQRFNIAIDVAEALDYLHNHGAVPIVHCDLKPGNVLLDDDMTAHVGDFGLARFLIRPDTMSSQSLTSTGRIKGSIGYIPPEYGMGVQPSVEGDVYSFGILLLEMFTGVSPVDERFTDEPNLPKSIELGFPEQVMNMVDAKLLSEISDKDDLYVLENVHNCLVSVIHCGLLCSKELPKERITIKDVAKQLNAVRTKLLRSSKQK